MRKMRGRGWLVNGFLWVCPLMALGLFLAAFLAGKAPPAPDNWNGSQFYDVPGNAALALLGGALLLSLVVAFFTRRVLGLLGGASVLLLLTAVTGWIRCQWCSEEPILAWVTGEAGNATFDGWIFDSSGDGMRLLRYQFDKTELHSILRRHYLSPGRDRTISYRSHSASKTYPSDDDDFRGMPQWLRRIGFGVAIDPQTGLPAGRERTLFAMALP